MNCPACDAARCKVVDSRKNEFVVARVRRCFTCKLRFSTLELTTEYLSERLKERPKGLSEKNAEIDSYLKGAVNFNSAEVIVKRERPIRKQKPRIRPKAKPKAKPPSKKPEPEVRRSVPQSKEKEVDRTWYLSEEEKLRRANLDK